MIVFKMKNGYNSIRLKLKFKCTKRISQALKNIVFKLLFILTSGFFVPHLHSSVVLLNAKELIFSNSTPRLFQINSFEKKIAGTVWKTNWWVN